MSSDFLWRKIDVAPVRDDLRGRAEEHRAERRHRRRREAGRSSTRAGRTCRTSCSTGRTPRRKSLLNTPPTFGIYLVRNVLEWIKGIGGLEAIEKRNRAKAAALYATIDADAGFYRAPVEKGSRSVMNVVFRLPSEELEKRFVDEAKKHGMVGLKGHRSVGGIRVSLYNAVEVEWVRELATFMKDFAKRAA